MGGFSWKLPYATIICEGGLNQISWQPDRAFSCWYWVAGGGTDRRTDDGRRTLSPHRVFVCTEWRTYKNRQYINSTYLQTLVVSFVPVRHLTSPTYTGHPVRVLMADGAVTVLQETWRYIPQYASFVVDNVRNVWVKYYYLEVRKLIRGGRKLLYCAHCPVHFSC